MPTESALVHIDICHGTLNELESKLKQYKNVNIANFV